VMTTASVALVSVLFRLTIVLGCWDVDARHKSTWNEGTYKRTDNDDWGEGVYDQERLG
jgi:major membrane immunogen (membrane-anchored lipoprotein)